MEPIVQLLKNLLSDTVSLKFKAHGYHWNVEGEDFREYHDFFQEIYEDYDGAIDTFAEWIRKLDEYAPFKLSRFMQLTSVEEVDITSNPEDMSRDLLLSNDAVTVKLVEAAKLAGEIGQFGLQNFFADRQEMHQKWHWQLKASISEMSTQSEMQPQSPTVTG